METLVKKTDKHHLIFYGTLLVALLVYASFLSFGHISWDDPEMVFKNRYVKTFDLNGLTTNHFVGNYIPVTMIVHAIAWLLFKGNELGHHALNIFFHLLNGILVYQLGNRLLKERSVSLIGMIVFLLHPVQIESVGWISELKNILSGTFYLAGLIFYLKYINGKQLKFYLVTLSFFILGCLSKSSVVVFPLSLICIDLINQKKISWKLIPDKIPFFLLSIIFGVINVKAQTEDQFINFSHAFPYAERLGYAGFALLKYLSMFLAPTNLSVIYPYPPNPTLAFVAGYFMMGVLSWVLFLTFKKNKFLYVALILFTLSNLILVLQFVPFGEVLYADRYLYIPVIGLAWIFGSLLNQLRPPMIITCTILLCLLGLSSYSRGRVWRSGVTLYEDILKNFPNSFVALNSIGVEYMLKNNNEKAFYYLNKSIQVAPYNYKGFYNRGLFFLKNQKAKEAVESFNASLAIYDYSKAYVGRASAYHMLGDIQKAMSDANSALQIDKNNPKAHYILGNCYNDLNKLEEALDEYNQSIKLNTEEADFYFKRGIVYGKMQDFNRCIADINSCLSLDPAHYEAYYWRGVAKVNLKQNACDDFKIAAQQNFKPSIDAYHKYCR